MINIAASCFFFLQGSNVHICASADKSRVGIGSKRGILHAYYLLVTLTCVRERMLVVLLQATRASSEEHFQPF